MSHRYPKWLIWSVEILFFIGLYLGLRAWQQRDMIQGEAPVFAAQRLDGMHFNMSDDRGAPLLLHFWATWCPVCRLGQSSIAGIAEDWPVITVAMQSGSVAEVSQHLAENSLNFPVIIDQEGVLARRYGVVGVPASFVIDGQGGIRFSEVGYTTGMGLRMRLWWAE
ncbi:MAG: protein disulfide oxidoreductase [Gammaproteobacteria bacterium]|nr:protein disulfide oxidoreductase [Gammaproteobacteria bacterium]